MAKPVVLRTDAELNMGAGAMDRLTTLASLVTAPDDEEQTLVELAPQADLIYRCYASITEAVIAASPRLRGIVKYGVGVDGIDIPAATRHGVPVVNCPDYGTDTVADQAFALLIGLARQMTLIDRDMRRKGWLWPEPNYLAVDLSGKTLGQIGFGRIGKAMARRGGGFGMKRLIYDPYVPQDAEGWGDLEFTTLGRVIEEADFLSLHCILTPETRHIIGKSEFERMKNTAFLIDVSRGALVDQAALVDALKNGEIAGAGFDVFPEEPLTLDHPLHQFDNVILTPHFAFYSREAHERLENECVDDIELLLRGELPEHTLNPEVREAWTEKLRGLA